MRYRDPRAAIDFLCAAFGFREHMVVEENGVIPHAQLLLGEDMIMLGQARDDDFGQHVTVPDASGKVTQAAYIVVDDLAAHYARARSAGAEIVSPLEEQSYGGAHYAARDPEGHLWSFGSYDPWAQTSS